MDLAFAKRTVAILTAVIIFAIGLYLFISSDNPVEKISAFLKNDINAFVFAILMTLLPLFGAPISIFLVLVGMKFGIIEGLVVTGGIILCHLLATYYLVHSFLRSWVVNVLGKLSIKIPRLPKRGKKRLGFVFMIFPGLPYAVKNYLFALTEMPFRPFIVISWIAQFGLSIPFIILGKGLMQMNAIILVTAIVLLLLSIVAQKYIREQYKNI